MSSPSRYEYINTSQDKTTRRHNTRQHPVSQRNTAHNASSNIIPHTKIHYVIYITQRIQHHKTHHTLDIPVIYLALSRTHTPTSLPFLSFFPHSCSENLYGLWRFRDSIARVPLRYRPNQLRHHRRRQVSNDE